MILRSDGVGLDCHAELLEEIVGDMMVGIVLEVRFVGLIGFKVDLTVLKYL